MAGKKKKSSDSEEPVDPNKEVNIKVYASERDLILKVAGARGDKKVPALFRSKEMRQFLKHLMAAAAKSEVERPEEDGKS